MTGCRHRGGAIGCGLAARDRRGDRRARGRRVIALQADGSAMYTLQALWTQAREKLPVTTVLLSNRKYQILIGEYCAMSAPIRAAPRWTCWTSATPTSTG